MMIRIRYGVSWIALKHANLNEHLGPMATSEMRVWVICRMRHAESNLRNEMCGMKMIG